MRLKKNMNDKNRKKKNYSAMKMVSTLNVC